MSPVLTLLLLCALRAQASPFEDAVAHMKHGRWEEAVVQLEAAEDAEPGSSEILMNLGWAYWRVGRLEDAWRCFDMLVKLDPKNPAHLRLLADVEDERGNYLPALALARRALELLPGDRDAALGLAKILSHLHRNEEATRILERLIVQYPDHPSVQFRMADHLASLGRLEEAIVYYDRLIHFDPVNTAFRRGRANVLYELGHFEEATAEWRELIALPQPDEKSLINLGWASWHAKDYDEAGKFGSMLVGLDDTNPKSLKFLASIRLEQRDAPAALRLARKALKLKPGDRDASLLLAKALFHLQRDKEALEVLTALSKRYPDFPSIQFHMGDFLTQLGRYPEALGLFDRLVEDAPANRIYRRRRAWILYELGRFDDARGQWKLLAQQRPPDREALERLAEDAFYRDLWEEALSWTRRLAGLRGLAPMDWQRLALIYIAMGRHSEGIEAAEKSIELDPYDPSGYYIKAETFERVSQWDAAEAVYQQVLSRNPNSYRAVASLARVAEAKGDFKRAVRLVRTMQRMPVNSQAALPYLVIEEARLLAEDRRIGEAMSVLRKVSRSHRASLPALLYHGVSKYNRRDNMTMPLDLFKEHMAALKENGYQSVDAVDLEKFGAGQGTLPDRAVLVTFDDARLDAFRNADPVLARHGMRATMFAHLTAVKKGGFHANPVELKRWQATGRWSIQAHGGRAHDPIRLDSAGRTGHFLANRMWLPQENRLETREEFVLRVEDDYRQAKEFLSTALPDARIVAFAYPFGDNGRIEASNIKDAAEINARLVQKYFSYAFVQDARGFNMTPYSAYDLTRFEVASDMTAAELIRHLSLQEPWVKARLLEASLWTRANQPGKALAIYDELERYGVKGPELLAQRGLAVRRTGDSWSAERLYARAFDQNPEEERYRTLLEQSRAVSGPTAGSTVEGFSDPYALTTLMRLRGGARLRSLHLDAWAGRGSYKEKDESRSPGVLTSKEAGGGARWFLTPRVDFAASYSKRLFTEGLSAQAYSLSGSMYVLPFARVTLSQGTGSVETPRALRLNRDYRRAGAGAALDLTVNWTASGDYQVTSFNDGNRQIDVRSQLIWRLLNQFSAGYAFRHAAARRTEADYYSPRRLNQHMALFIAGDSFGAVSKTTGLKRFNARLQYGAGYGWHDRGSRAVHSVRGQFLWRIVDSLAGTADGLYTTSPTYVSRSVALGLGLSF